MTKQIEQFSFSHQSFSHQSFSHRLALSLCVVLLVGFSWLGGWLAIPWGAGGWLFSKPMQGRAAQTKLAIAIETTMKTYLPVDKERDVILSWIQSGGQRHHFYERVWPILRMRCHRCHGSFNRANGAMPLVRFSQIAPMVQSQVVLRRHLLTEIQRLFPHLSILFLLLGLLVAFSSFSNREKSFWIVAPVVALGLHIVGLWAGLTQVWGVAIAAYASLFWILFSTVLAVRLLVTWWCPDDKM